MDLVPWPGWSQTSIALGTARPNQAQASAIKTFRSGLNFHCQQGTTWANQMPWLTFACPSLRGGITKYHIAIYICNKITYLMVGISMAKSHLCPTEIRISFTGRTSSSTRTFFAHRNALRSTHRLRGSNKMGLSSE